MNFLNKLKGSAFSKTANMALVLVIIGIGEQISPNLISQLVPTEYSGLAVSLTGATFWVLRWVTSKPLDAK